MTELGMSAKAVSHDAMREQRYTPRPEAQTLVQSEGIVRPTEAHVEITAWNHKRSRAHRTDPRSTHVDILQRVDPYTEAKSDLSEERL